MLFLSFYYVICIFSFIFPLLLWKIFFRLRRYCYQNHHLLLCSWCSSLLAFSQSLNFFSVVFFLSLLSSKLPSALLWLLPSIIDITVKNDNHTSYVFFSVIVDVFIVIVIVVKIIFFSIFDAKIMMVTIKEIIYFYFF